MLAVLVSGLGVAAYHPEGSKFASYVSGDRRASGMAFFSVGGNVGFALGPLLASFVVITLGLGLDGGVLLAVPGLVVAGVLLVAAAATSRASPRTGGDRRAAGGRERLRAGLRCCSASSACASVAHMGLFTFIPLYEISRGNSAALRERGCSSLFLLAGAVGTLLGGPARRPLRPPAGAAAGASSSRRR